MKCGEGNAAVIESNTDTIHAAQDKLKAAMKGGRSAEAMTSRVGQFDTAALAIGGKQGNDERRDALLREIRNELRNKKPVAA